MSEFSVIRDFLTRHGGTPVGLSPPVAGVTPADADPPAEVDFGVEVPEPDWFPRVVSEAPPRPGEVPTRFIDGTHLGEPVLCLRSARGWPVPLVVSEVGAIALRHEGRRLVRDYFAVERVLSFVVDPFPWHEVERFADALVNLPGLELRVVPANRPAEAHSPFDYDVMRNQARARAMQEMTTLERLALAVRPDVPTLIDGPLRRVTGEPDPRGSLVVGVVKSHSNTYLTERGWRTLYDLKPGQRTPVFKVNLDQTPQKAYPIATWFLKLAHGPELAPNYGFVRVEVAWDQFVHGFRGDFGMIDRLSRWLIDARCRSASYARMPVSLEPIVRAEALLAPLLTPLSLLVSRFHRQAGTYRRNER